MSIYRNDLKNRGFGKEAPQNSRLERATIAYRQGASEGENFEGRPTLPKTDSLGCFGIPKETQVLWCFGAPSQEEKGELLAFLAEKEGRSLVLVEEEEVPFLSLHCAFAEHPQIDILFAEDKEELKKRCWQHVLRPFHCVVSAGKRVGTFFSELASCQRGVNLLASDYSDLGQKIASNTLANLAYAADHCCREGMLLRGALRGVPAVVCGAGPSLAHHAALLSELSCQAALFAGGSAVAALKNGAVLCHVTGCIDPDPSYERFLEGTAFTSLFCYQSRFSKRLLPLAHGEKLWFPDNGGHGLENALLGRDESFAGGWTVATFLVAVAAHLGCTPILLAGVDLCHASLGETQEDWILSAEWLSAFVSAHPKTRFLRLGTSGLPIEGIDSISSEEAREMLRGGGDVAGRIHAVLQGVERGGFSGALTHVRTGLERLCLLLDRLLLLHEQAYPQLPLSQGEYILLESDLEEEEVYQKVILPVWGVWQHLLQREVKEPETFPLHRLLFLKRLCTLYLKEFKDVSA